MFFYDRKRREIENLPYDDKVKQTLLEILHYIKNHAEKKIKEFLPFNFIFYTASSRMVDEVVDFLEAVIREYAYLPRLCRQDVSAAELVLDKSRAAELFDLEEGAESKLLVIKNADTFANITNLGERNAILDMLMYSGSKHDNIFTIICGDEKRLKPLLMERAEAYSTDFNVKLSFENFTEETVARLVIEHLRDEYTVMHDAKTAIIRYVESDYCESVLKNYDYAQNLCRKIVFANGAKENYDKTIYADEMPPQKRKRDLGEILIELNGLTGLNNIKQQVDELVALLEFNNKAQHMLSLNDLNLHMIFTGTPGTGKTMVARIVAEILYQLGYVKQNKLVEVEAKDLIGEYVGQTSIKTDNVIRSAMDGVLFIDEAYATVGGSTKGKSADFGMDFIATLIKSMEDYKNRLVIILAGYENEMAQFIQSNPGLRSRIGYRVNFEDYTVDELVQIFRKRVEKGGFDITGEAMAKVRAVIEYNTAVENFGNARFVVNLFQDIVLNHAVNMRGVEDEGILRTITEDDIMSENLK